MRVQKTTGLTGNVMEAMGKKSESSLRTVSDAIREFSLYTTSTAVELAGFAEQLGQLGVVDENSMIRLMRTVEMMSIATEISSDEVALSMGRIATAFGWDLNTETGVRNVERLSNVINKLENDTAATAGEIITAIYNAASVASQLDIPAQDLAAIVSMMVSMGVNADAAGTRLSRWFTQITTKSEKFAELMAGYTRDGIVVYEDAQAVMDKLNTKPVEALTDAMDALSRVTSDEKAQGLAAFFDVFGYIGAKVGVLAGNTTGLANALKTANSEWDSGKSLQYEYNLVLDTTQAHFQILKNNLRESATVIASEFMPVINRMLEYVIPGIQILTKAFSSLSWETKLMVVGIPILVAVLIPLLLVFAQLSHGISLIVVGFMMFIRSFFTLFGVVGKLLSLFFAVGKAISIVGKTVGLLTLGWKALIPILAGVAGAIALVAAAVGGTLGVLKILEKMGVDVGRFFSDLAENAANWGEGLMRTYGDGLIAGAARYVANVVSRIAGWIASFFEAHSPPVVGPLSTIDQWGSSLMNTYLKGFLNADFDILSQVGRIIGSIFESFADLKWMDEEQTLPMLLQAREAIAQVIDVFNRTGTIATDVLDSITSGMGTLGEDVKQSGFLLAGLPCHPEEDQGPGRTAQEIAEELRG